MAIIPVFAEILDLLLSNPLLAWLTVISAFAVDSWISSYVKFQGIGGWVATQAIQFLTGNHQIVITSFQILVLIVIFPIIIFALQKSRQNVGR
jgi:hypothetical protein